MKTYLDLIISILTLVTMASGLYFAIRRFGLKRERFTFLRMAIDAKVVQNSGDLVLVSVVVHLENKGDTRISARCQRREDGYLYNDGQDVCLHAGTLKIRQVPPQDKPLLFDWYSLAPISVPSRLVPEDKLEVKEGDLEQINYLGEFQDAETGYKEVGFWLEPHESYDLLVPIWLHPGTYLAKAFFLGPMTKQREEEYWSCTTLFSLGSGRS